MIRNCNSIVEMSSYMGFKITKVIYNNVRYQGLKDGSEIWANSLDELKKKIKLQVKIIK